MSEEELLFAGGERRDPETMFGFPIEDMRKLRRVGYFFRYPLAEKDFRPVDLGGRHLGAFCAKALYNGVDERGRVDRGSGFGGEIAALFVPVGARSAIEAVVLLAHVEPTRVAHANGTRNRPAILDAARRRIFEFVLDDRDAAAAGSPFLPPHTRGERGGRSGP